MQGSALFGIAVSIYIEYNQAGRNLHTLYLSPCSFSERRYCFFAAVNGRPV